MAVSAVDQELTTGLTVHRGAIPLTPDNRVQQQGPGSSHSGYHDNQTMGVRHCPVKVTTNGPWLVPAASNRWRMGRPDLSRTRVEGGSGRGRGVPGGGCVCPMIL